MTAETTGPEGPITDPAARRREQRGWYFYDFACSVYSTSVVTVFLGPYLTSVAENAAGGEDGLVYPLGIPVAPGSLFPYAVSVSLVVAIVAMPLVSAAADRRGRKKPLLAAAAYIGAGATTGMFFLEGTRYLLGAFLLIVANAAFAVAMMLYNAYLPQIAGPEERDEVSSRGWAFGYTSGALVLVLNLVLYSAHDSFGLEEGEAVRICLASAGLWWGAFALIPLRRLRDRRLPPAAAGADGAAGSGTVGAGWRQLRSTLKDMRRHPLTLAFLLAYLVYNDGVQTVISQAAIFGEKELGLEKTTLITAVLLVQVLAVAGALLMARFARTHGAKRTILGALLVWTVILLAGYLLPAGAPVLFFCLAAAIGLVMGGTQALSRSLFSHLVPEGKEAEYFSAYELSDRGLSWLGPLMFGLVYQLTDSYRAAIISLLVFFVAGFALLARVPVRDAVRAAGNVVPERI
ncbi:MFS transporter [Streptomyces sp. CC208A]|uniref:MFS transporter n=1 Tax=Streptomyces sp. CC208A TaxID=3044573 RepID=UPI0024A99A13|nr:MFS transporter [Streptomyces sp. CC208A]